MQVGQPMYTAQAPVDNPQLPPQIQALIRARMAQQQQQLGTQPVINGVQQTLTPGQQAILNYMQQNPAATVQQQNSMLMHQFSPGVGTLATPTATASLPGTQVPATQMQPTQMQPAPNLQQPMATHGIPGTMVPATQMQPQGMGGGGLSQGGMNALARYYQR